LVALCQELGAALDLQQAQREKVLLNLIFFLSLQPGSKPKKPEIVLPENHIYVEETIALMRFV
jgi:hypothetical protein